MPTAWHDTIKSRSPKQLTIFFAPHLNKPWRRAFDDALKTFNRLSAAHQLGVTMVGSTAQPDPDGAPELHGTWPDDHGQGLLRHIDARNTQLVSMQVGRGKFNQVQREAGHGVKHLIAAHELIHVCGLVNSDHTHFGANADLFIELPQPDAGPFSKPDEDQLVLCIATAPKPNVFSPPIFLDKATIDLIKQNWR